MDISFEDIYSTVQSLMYVIQDEHKNIASIVKINTKLTEQDIEALKERIDKFNDATCNKYN